MQHFGKSNRFGVPAPKAGALPVAVPDLFLGFQKPSSAIDRCHSLGSLDSATGGDRLAPQLGHTRIWWLL